MSRSAASSCALVNSGGDSVPFSRPDSFATLFSTLFSTFLGAAMAIPDERDDQSSLTQLKPPWKDCVSWRIYCYAAVQRGATFLQSISRDFEICGIRRVARGRQARAPARSQNLMTRLRNQFGLMIRTRSRGLA